MKQNIQSEPFEFMEGDTAFVEEADSIHAEEDASDDDVDKTQRQETPSKRKRRLKFLENGGLGDG